MSDDLRAEVGALLKELADAVSDFSEAFYWDGPTRAVPIPDGSEVYSSIHEATYQVRLARRRLEDLVAPHKVATLQWLLAEAEHQSWAS